jgi:hypothetical protein
MEQSRRLFTVSEAKALLPTLRPLLKSIQSSKRALDAGSDEIQSLTESMKTNGQATRATEIELRMAELVEEIREKLITIHEMGVEMKDLDLGLVDFPSTRDGRVVYLCWTVDEPEIAFWHEVDAGVAGRQPL